MHTNVAAHKLDLKICDYSGKSVLNQLIDITATHYCLLPNGLYFSHIPQKICIQYEATSWIRQQLQNYMC